MKSVCKAAELVPSASSNDYLPASRFMPQSDLRQFDSFHEFDPGHAGLGLYGRCSLDIPARDPVAQVRRSDPCPCRSAAAVCQPSESRAERTLSLRPAGAGGGLFHVDLRIGSWAFQDRLESGPSGAGVLRSGPVRWLKAAGRRSCPANRQNAQSMSEDLPRNPAGGGFQSACRFASRLA